MIPDMLLPVAIPVILIIAWLFISVNVLREYERAVVFRLGRVLDAEKGPG